MLKDLCQLGSKEGFIAFAVGWAKDVVLADSTRSGVESARSPTRGDSSGVLDGPVCLLSASGPKNAFPPGTRLNDRAEMAIELEL